MRSLAGLLPMLLVAFYAAESSAETVPARPTSRADDGVGRPPPIQDEPPPDRRLYLSFSPFHLSFPLVEITAEVRLHRRIGLAVVGGVGSMKVDEKDLKVDVYRSSGPGGQGVNTTDSAVRITHLPTGLVVTCQDERSQIKNRAKALRVLRARLLEAAQEEQRSQIAAARKSQVGTGERSERIRTYNFPQGRVTDHRIGLTVHQLPDVLEGDLDELAEALLAAERTEQLESDEA